MDAEISACPWCELVYKVRADAARERPVYSLFASEAWIGCSGSGQDSRQDCCKEHRLGLEADWVRSCGGLSQAFLADKPRVQILVLAAHAIDAKVFFRELAGGSALP
jgi:hypothetical protein